SGVRDEPPGTSVDSAVCVPADLHFVLLRVRSDVHGPVALDDGVVGNDKVLSRPVWGVEPNAVLESGNHVAGYSNVLTNHADVEAACTATERCALADDGVAGHDHATPSHLHADRLGRERVTSDGDVLAALVRVDGGLPGPVRRAARDREVPGDAPILGRQRLGCGGGDHVA